MEFDILFYAFGKMGTVIQAWLVMFVYTLLVPYYTLVLWGHLYHVFPYKLELSVGTVLSFAAVQTYVLGLCPIHVVVDNQLPPASRFIVILEQVSVWSTVVQMKTSIWNQTVYKTNVWIN